jgi:hypothetical protein
MGVTQVPLKMPMEFIVQCTPLSILSAVAFYFILHWNPFIFFLCNLLAWTISDYVLIYVIKGSKIKCPVGTFFLACLCRDFITCTQVMWAFFKPSVIRWTRASYRIGWDGKIKEVIPHTTAVLSADNKI